MRGLLLVVAATAVIVLGGCAPLACPTIGYGSTVSITTGADVVELECVEGCDGALDDPYATGPDWRIEAPQRPDTITVVGRDAAGVELFREIVPLTWTVADPGNPCGSSASADPVTLSP